MVITPIGDCIRLSPGSQVPATKGQIKKVGKVFSGENTYGPWTIQTLEMMDATGKVKVKLMNRAELAREWVGQWVYFEAGVNGKGKPSGLEMEEDNYRGVTSMQIKVNEHAIMTAASVRDGQQAQAPAQPAAPPVAPPVAPPATQAPPPVAPPQAGPVAPPQTHRPTPGSAEDKAQCVARVKHRLGQVAVARQLAFDAVIYVAKAVEAKHGVSFTITELSAMATSMSIDLERSDLVDCLPTRLDEPAKQ